jgi:hypothetical protein
MKASRDHIQSFSWCRCGKQILARLSFAQILGDAIHVLVFYRGVFTEIELRKNVASEVEPSTVVWGGILLISMQMAMQDGGRAERSSFFRSAATRLMQAVTMPVLVVKPSSSTSKISAS